MKSVFLAIILKIALTQNENALIRFVVADKRKMFASVAQSVEQWIENPRVGGSIPPRGTISRNPNQETGWGF